MADGSAHARSACLAELTRMLPDRVTTAMAVRQHHANTLTGVPAQAPDAVVWPETEAEVSAIVRLAAGHGVPLIAFGAGTSLEGHVNAPSGGISVDFSKLDKVLAVRPGDMDCTVQAGVTLQQLNLELKPTGLFFPVDPGAEYATLGGMASTRASGTTTVRYGSMRDNVVAVTAVLASGDIIQSARRARKSAAGYDLTRLLVGSEGTLGLITSLTLKLYGVPEAILAAVASFDTVSQACVAATQAIQLGLGLARIELLDAVQMGCINSRARLGFDDVPTLFVEFHGSPAACQHDVAAFQALAADSGSRSFRSATDVAGRRVLWKARHDAFWSVKAAWPGRQVLVTDVAVPLSALAAAVTETADDIVRSGLTAPIVGHVGDGNFHAIIVYDAEDAAERAKVDAFLERLAARALSHDGSVTGEHGIGQGKARFMAAEHGAALGVMRAVKAALDPLGILNPGKIF